MPKKMEEEIRRKYGDRDRLFGLEEEKTGKKLKAVPASLLLQCEINILFGEMYKKCAKESGISTLPAKSVVADGMPAAKTAS